MTQEVAGAPAGWYPATDGSRSERYWDGATWTDQIRPIAPSAPPPAPASSPNIVPPPGAALPVISFITGLFGISIVAIIVGHVALRRSKKYEAAGGRFDGVTTSYMRGAQYGFIYAGLILGYIGAVGWIILWVFFGILSSATLPTS